MPAALADRRSWTTSTIDDPSNWYHVLSPTCVAAVERAVRAAPDVPVTAVRLHGDLVTCCRTELAPARAALETGRGFVILSGWQTENRPVRESQLAYWLLGQALGQPFAQNVEGTLLYDVRDTGQDVAYGARFSVTNAESTYHTDNSFGDTVLDYVGLLCLRSARSGGLSQVVSGWTVVRALAEERPDVLHELARPFHVDRRGGVRPGQTPTARIPVIAQEGDELLVRYLRYWIEAGQQKVNEPLTPVRRAALDTFDEWLARPEWRVEFMMRPGEMQFINNRWLLHNRTAFEDYTEPEQKRHLVRLWLCRVGLSEPVA